jgi:hypothetical protein
MDHSALESANEPGANGRHVGVRKTGCSETCVGVERRKDFQDESACGRLLAREDRLDLATFVRLAACGPERPQAHVAQLVVGDDVLGFDPDQRQQRSSSGT